MACRAYRFVRRRTATGREHYEELLFLTELSEAGKITPVDRTYPERSPDAIRYLEEGRGKVVITV